MKNCLNPNHTNPQIYHTKPTLPYQTKPTKPNQTYQTKPTEANLPYQPYQTEFTEPNQTYQIKSTKQNLLNKPYQTIPAKSKITNQTKSFKLNKTCQIKKKIKSKPDRSRLAWAWHSSASACSYKWSYQCNVCVSEKYNPKLKFLHDIQHENSWFLILLEIVCVIFKWFWYVRIL